MNERPLHELSIPQAARLLREGAITSVKLTEAALARVALLDPHLHAFITLTPDRAMADARQADAAFSRGIDHGPLQGIPYALKDIIDTAAIRTTAQSRLLLDHVPSRDAVVAAKLREAGGVLLGKLATYEFAVVGPSFDLPFPSARNPWNVAHITGGSSSGAAAAVGGGLVRTAIGTDSGGSIRSPAGYCGVVGLKPTYGLVSRRGVHPLAYSMDHVGPLSASVEEAAMTLDAIAGLDVDDPGSAHRAGEPASSRLGRELRGMRLGYARKFHLDEPEASPEVISALDDAVSQLSLLGAAIEEVDLPAYQIFEDCGAVIIAAEAYAIHEQQLRRRAAEYGRLAYLCLAAGVALSAADLVQAQRVRRQLCETVNGDVFAGLDALIVANTLTTAPRFDTFDGITPKWTAMRTLPFNVTGNPVLALPIGLARNGLPMSMQIVGKPFDEAKLCQIGAAYETSIDWPALRPPPLASR